jgi:glycosyltransferase involved in cell wall biosynthesis
VESLGLQRNRIYLGYDAVDNAHFEEGARHARLHAESLRTELGLPSRFFFACTRFIRRKNVDGLLRAYAAYRQAQTREPWGLVIAGSGEDHDQLRALCRNLVLHEVVWPGFLQYDQLPVYYGLASAFVHPATCEPWGLVVNEAAASGLPLLVARPVGASYELVEPGGNGFVFDPSSEGDITRSLIQLAEVSEAQRTTMGRRSRDIASDWSPARFGHGLWLAVEAARGRVGP